MQKTTLFLDIRDVQLKLFKVLSLLWLLLVSCKQTSVPLSTGKVAVTTAVALSRQ